jgi:hypothetical protein
MKLIYSTHKYNKDKSGLYCIYIFIMSILSSIFGIWAVIEFILYLVKDNPFNWWSLGLTIATIIGAIYYFIRYMLSI